MGVTDEQRLESVYVSRGVVVVALTFAVLVAANLGHAWLYPSPERFEIVVRCLEREKRLLVFDASVESSAFKAGVDAVRTTIETNRVTIAVAESVEEAAALERASVLDTSRERVERRGEVVYEWRAPPSPTQRQGAYDCTG